MIIATRKTSPKFRMLAYLRNQTDSRSPHFLRALPLSIEVEHLDSYWLVSAHLSHAIRNAMTVYLRFINSIVKYFSIRVSQEKQSNFVLWNRMNAQPCNFWLQFTMQIVEVLQNNQKLTVQIINIIFSLSDCEKPKLLPMLHHMQASGPMRLCAHNSISAKHRI